MLTNHFGPQLEASREDGRDMMADALHERFDLPIADARHMIDVLEQTGTIHWVEKQGNTELVNPPFGGMPVVGAILPIGHWQLQAA